MKIYWTSAQYTRAFLKIRTCSKCYKEGKCSVSEVSFCRRYLTRLCEQASFLQRNYWRVPQEHIKTSSPILYSLNCWISAHISHKLGYWIEHSLVEQLDSEKHLLLTMLQEEQQNAKTPST